MYIEEVLEMLEQLDGAGIVIEDLDLVSSELEVMGFEYRDIPNEFDED